MVVTLEEFGSCIRRTAAECLQLSVFMELVTEAKVRKLYVEVRIQQQILGLETYSMFKPRELRRLNYALFTGRQYCMFCIM